MAETHRRAQPLGPDDRRQAIIEAVIPLLLEKGALVTSREMAEVADIAEGTIFGVFPDRRSVIVEAVKTIMDPGPVQIALEQISHDLPIEDQFRCATEILLEQGTRIVTLVGVLHTVLAPNEGNTPRARRFIADSNAVVVSALAVLFGRHRDLLTIDPERAAIALRGFIFANTHPLISPEKPLSTDEIVQMLMHGVVGPSQHPAT